MKEIVYPAAKLPEYTLGDFTVDAGGNLIVLGDKTETPVAPYVAERMYEFMTEGLPYDPLRNFWINCMENTKPESVVDLYRFLEVNNCPITPDGLFLAYKGVKGDVNNPESWVDAHSGKFSNSPGTLVKMKREDCDDNNKNTCSAGLHVGSHNYAKNFAPILLEVAVHPKNVVAVPHDYNSAKMRTCEYLVLGLADHKKEGLYFQANSKAPVKEVEAYENDEEIVGDVLDLCGKSAREIVDLMNEKYEGFYIDPNFKNKKGIIKKAINKLSDEKVSFNVEERYT